MIYGMAIDILMPPRFQFPMPPQSEEDKNAVERAVVQLAERLRPQMEECGVTGFVLFAFISDADGKIRKVSLGGYGPEMADACKVELGPWEVLGAKWSAGQL